MIEYNEDRTKKKVEARIDLDLKDWYDEFHVNGQLDGFKERITKNFADHVDYVVRDIGRQLGEEATVVTLTLDYYGKYYDGYTHFITATGWVPLDETEKRALARRLAKEAIEAEMKKVNNKIKKLRSAVNVLIDIDAEAGDVKKLQARLAVLFAERRDLEKARKEQNG